VRKHLYLVVFTGPLGMSGASFGVEYPVSLSIHTKTSNSLVKSMLRGSLQFGGFLLFGDFFPVFVQDPIPRLLFSSDGIVGAAL